ncbi:MAG: type IV secretion system protein [Proteobacteria bacterium]|nr:type IV secretion system protein [Pseudomonadota bacterium]
MYFQIIFAYLGKEIENMRDNMMGGFIQWILLFGSIMVTSWIIFQGWLVVTGRSRESMMALVTNSMRVVLITLCATTFTFMGSDISKLLTETVPQAITGVVTGDESSPAHEIDKGFMKMQGMFALVDALGASAGGHDGFKDQLSRVTTMSAIGTAGPAVVGGALLLMYKAALGLFVGFGPLFIFALLFQSTKQLFSKWLYYGIGTMFSLAVLSFMVAVAMKLVVATSLAMIAKYTLIMQGAGAAQGMDSIAMQQGGLGLILSILLVSVPPMAAQFFQGTVGGLFNQNSMFGNTGGGMRHPRDAQGNPLNGGAGSPSASNSNPNSGELIHQQRHGGNRYLATNQSSVQQESGPLPQRNFQPGGATQ